VGRSKIIVTPDFHGGCDGHGWTGQRTSAPARDGQDSGRFGKDGGNERENGTNIPRRRRAAVAKEDGANLSHQAYLSELTTLECEAQRVGRIKRLMTWSNLHPGKTWENFKLKRLALHVARQLETLRDGSFLDRRENVLIFGKPGSGKSHALCALSEQLILQGRSLLFTTCSLLVQQLLIAKRDLRLPKMIKQLSSFEGLIIDDLGYVQQSVLDAIVQANINMNTISQAAVENMLRMEQRRRSELG
jgi:DNA replication protein DnaC